MAKLVSLSIPFPELGMSGNFMESFKKQQEALEKLQKEPRAPNSFVGALMHFSVADGQAWYRVEKERPLCLSHIPFGDAYRIPDAHLRGIKLDDVKLAVKRDEALNALFAKGKK